jgi:hypothetical protein
MHPDDPRLTPAQATEARLSRGNQHIFGSFKAPEKFKHRRSAQPQISDGCIAWLPSLVTNLEEVMAVSLQAIGGKK